jgi:hypothetical protein
MIVVARRSSAAVSVPLGIPTVPTPRVAVNGTSVSTAAFTPPAFSLLFVQTYSRFTAAIAPCTIAGGGLTWNVLTDQSHDVGSGTRARQRVWCATIGSSPPAGMVVQLTATTSRHTMSLVSITGNTTIPTNFSPQTAGSADTAGDPVATMASAPAASSTILSFFGGVAAADTPIAVPVGGGTFTELEDAWDGSGLAQAQTCYLVGGGNQVLTWTSSLSSISFGAAVEVPLA